MKLPTELRNGRPVIILTHTGAKSGLTRKSPLMRIEHNGNYAIVASNGGGTKPLWAANVAANPVVQLQDGAVTQTMRAREIFGDEKDEWWGYADATYPTFAEYRKGAGREIPIFLLEPQ